MSSKIRCPTLGLSSHCPEHLISFVRGLQKPKPYIIRCQGIKAGFYVFNASTTSFAIPPPFKSQSLHYAMLCSTQPLKLKNPIIFDSSVPRFPFCYLPSEPNPSSRLALSSQPLTTTCQAQRSSKKSSPSSPSASDPTLHAKRLIPPPYMFNTYSMPTLLVLSACNTRRGPSHIDDRARQSTELDFP